MTSKINETFLSSKIHKSYYLKFYELLVKNIFLI